MIFNIVCVNLCDNVKFISLKAVINNKIVIDKKI